MTSSSSPIAARSFTSRKFSVLLVGMLALLTLQGWSGDTVNIFLPASATTTPLSSFFPGFFSVLEGAGPLADFHMSVGILLSVLAVVVFALSFVWSKSRGVRIASGLGLLMVISAAIGGFLFVMSGLSDGGNSAQMGGSFIGAYAFYFIALYYSRNVAEVHSA